MSKHSNIKVGILIPTFNRVIFLKSALESALDQSVQQLHILVIDNGSTDHTKDYMATIRDDRVSYIINEQNLGLIGSINKGVDLFHSNVEWCTILCDDDRLSRDFIEVMLNTIENRKAKSIIHSHRIFINADGERIREALDSVDEESGLEYIKSRSENLRETYLTGVFFHRKKFKEIGCYPRFTTGVGTDDAFIFALSIKDRLIYQRKTHVFITIHPGAESQEYENFPNVFQTIIELIEYCKKIYFLENLSKKISYTDMQKIMTKYQRRINSNICLGKFWEKNIFGKEMKELLDTVSKNPKCFSLRVNLNVFLIKKYKINAEQFLPYRVFFGLAEFIHKKMH